MEAQLSNKPYLIFLSHEDKEFQTNLELLIKNNLKNVLVKTFESRASIPFDHEISMADLIIVDLNFDDESINKIHNGLIEIHHKNNTPYLLIIDDSKFDKDKISFVNDYNNLKYEFINQNCFNNYVFLNRIKVLLSIPKLSHDHDLEKELIQNNIWKLLDYCNLYILILDKNSNIKLINYYLIKSLGYDNEKELIGKSWLNYIKPSNHDLITHVHDEILKGNKAYNEFTNDFYTKDNKAISVKWFNTAINSEFNCTFSIGIPLTKEPTIDEDIDSLRSYFRDILEQDKTTINAMKEVTMKYSKKIFNKEKE